MEERRSNARLQCAKVLLVAFSVALALLGSLLATAHLSVKIGAQSLFVPQLSSLSGLPTELVSVLGVYMVGCAVLGLLGAWTEAKGPLLAFHGLVLVLLVLVVYAALLVEEYGELRAGDDPGEGNIRSRKNARGELLAAAVFLILSVWMSAEVKGWAFTLRRLGFGSHVASVACGLVLLAVCARVTGIVGSAGGKQYVSLSLQVSLSGQSGASGNRTSNAAPNAARRMLLDAPAKGDGDRQAAEKEELERVRRDIVKNPAERILGTKKEKRIRRRYGKYMDATSTQTITVLVLRKETKIHQANTSLSLNAHFTGLNMTAPAPSSPASATALPGLVAGCEERSGSSAKSTEGSEESKDGTGTERALCFPRDISASLNSSLNGFSTFTFDVTAPAIGLEESKPFPASRSPLKWLIAAGTLTTIAGISGGYGALAQSEAALSVHMCLALPAFLILFFDAFAARAADMKPGKAGTKPGERLWDLIGDNYMSAALLGASLAVVLLISIAHSALSMLIATSRYARGVSLEQRDLDEGDEEDPLVSGRRPGGEGSSRNASRVQAKRQEAALEMQQRGSSDGKAD